jgi:hypothetical protein
MGQRNFYLRRIEWAVRQAKTEGLSVPELEWLGDALKLAIGHGWLTR